MMAVIPKTVPEAGTSSSLAEIAWAYHVEQLRAKQQTSRAKIPGEEARDVVLAAYWS